MVRVLDEILSKWISGEKEKATHFWNAGEDLEVEVPLPLSLVRELHGKENVRKRIQR